MMKLHELYKLIENNDDCVILQLKDGCENELWKVPFFDGNEKDIKISKGGHTTVSIRSMDGKAYSWGWGDNGYTLTSENITKKGHLLKEVLELDYGIYMGGNTNKRKSTNHISDYGQAEDCKIKLMYWSGQKNNVIIHKDDEFIKAMPTIEDAMEWLELRYYLNNMVKSVASTGVHVMEYTASLIYQNQNFLQNLNEFER